MKERGNFEVAEFAFGAMINMPQDSRCQWKYYANNVAGDDPRHSEFAKNPSNKYGAWRFNKVVADFEPDYVAVIGDPWYYEYIQVSPLRKYFNFIPMPTCDSVPYKIEWLDQLLNSEKVLTYSNFAAKTLLEQSNNKIPVYGPAYAGVDVDIYKPLPKDQVRASLNLNQDHYILGSVMRNQPRKLIPALFKAFAEAAEKQNNLVLYLHTGYPDATDYNIPRLLHEHGIQNKVLFSYKCRSCGVFRPTLFKGIRAHCQSCGKEDAYLTTNAFSLDDNQLNMAFNVMDFYIQYANAAGFEMPIAEAAATGLPGMCIDYAAMEDFKDTINYIPLKPLTYQVSPAEDNYRAIPNDEDTANKILEFCQYPKEIIRTKGFQIRKQCEDLYSWERVTDRWEECLSSIPVKDLWNSPKRLVEQISEKTELPTFELIAKIREVFKINATVHEMTLYEQIVNGDMAHSVKKQYMDRKGLINYLNNLTEEHNYWEEIRVGERFLDKNEDFIQYAKIKEELYN